MTALNVTAAVPAPGHAAGLRTPSSGSKNCLGASGFLGGSRAFSARVGSGSQAGQRGALVIQMAATKEKKSRDLNILKSFIESENTMLVAGFAYEGLSVKNMQKFRNELPEGAHLVVAKNTLMVKATEGTPYESISQCCTGMNAWLFVDENIAPCVKGINKLTKEWKKEGLEVDFSGAVLDGKFIAPTEMKPLESLPTKKDLIQKIAVCVKQVPTKVARGTKGVSSKLAYGVKAIADGESDLISA